MTEVDKNLIDLEGNDVINNSVNLIGGTAKSTLDILRIMDKIDESLSTITNFSYKLKIWIKDKTITDVQLSEIIAYNDLLDGYLITLEQFEFSLNEESKEKINLIKKTIELLKSEFDAILGKTLNFNSSDVLCNLNEISNIDKLLFDELVVSLRFAIKRNVQLMKQNMIYMEGGTVLCGKLNERGVLNGFYDDNFDIDVYVDGLKISLISLNTFNLTEYGSFNKYLLSKRNISNDGIWALGDEKDLSDRYMIKVFKIKIGDIEFSAIRLGEYFKSIPFKDTYLGKKILRLRRKSEYRLPKGVNFDKGIGKDWIIEGVNSFTNTLSFSFIKDYAFRNRDVLGAHFCNPISISDSILLSELVLARFGKEYLKFDGYNTWEKGMIDRLRLTGSILNKKERAKFMISEISNFLGINYSEIIGGMMNDSTFEYINGNGIKEDGSRGYSSNGLKSGIFSICDRTDLGGVRPSILL